MLTPQWSGQVRGLPITVILNNLFLGVTVVTAKILRERGNVRFREIIWKIPK